MQLRLIKKLTFQDEKIATNYNSLYSKTNIINNCYIYRLESYAMQMQKILNLVIFCLQTYVAKICFYNFICLLYVWSYLDKHMFK